MRIGICWTVTIVALSVAPLTAFAQETTGRIEGRAVDTQGPVVGVSVSVTSPALQGARGCMTDAQGRFVILALSVGEYTVRLAHVAYRTRTVEGVRVALGQITSLGDVQLETKVLDQPEVVVTGRPLVDPASTESGGVLAASDFTALPIDRDYRSVAALLPHANASYLGDPVNFAGATGLENRYFVDGIDVTDPYRSATGTRLPYNFIQELQIRTGGYGAQYRSSLGGATDAVTYSGGNTVTGQVFGFFTGNAFSATPRSVPGESAENMNYALYDVGFGVGGPILRDRLWYYAAYNPSHSTEDVAVPGWDDQEDWSTVHSFAGKLTWRVDDRNTLVLTTLGDPTTGRMVFVPVNEPASLDPLLIEIRRGGVNAMLEGRSVLSDQLLLQASLTRSTRDEDSTPETEIGRTEPLFIDSLGVGSGGAATQEYGSRVTLATLHATWIGSGQDVKAGVEYRDTHLDFDSHFTWIQQYGGSIYYYQEFSYKGQVGSRAPSAFVQHTWHPARRWTVTDGLRWDGQYLISSEGEVAQSIGDEWQPRIGVTFQPGPLGTQKIYASFGRFYQDLSTAPLQFYYNQGSYFLSALYDHDPRVDPSGADTIGYIHVMQPEIIGLQGQHFDEFSLGYERQVGERLRMDARIIHRVLRQGIEDGIDPQSGVAGLSNPGLGALAAFPAMKRKYTALELSCQGRIGRDLDFLASYVLSRNYGNHEGLFDSRFGAPWPNAAGYYDVIDLLVNATGLLPNDRAHVLKLSGSYRMGYGITLGATGIYESGTPVSEFGGTPTGGIYYGFIDERGSHGRTPAIWDANLRVGYRLPVPGEGRVAPQLTLDVMHLFSQRKATRYDEVHYRALDESGNQTDPNPNYRRPLSYQPPMAVRLGMEVGF